ncbi:MULTISPECIES: hypothetical protein [Streptomyces]|uniref:hypothetical protein n=1 Tax=Streptomyces TaxID=1883 RepID=UPI002FDC2840
MLDQFLVGDASWVMTVLLFVARIPVECQVSRTVTEVWGTRQKRHSGPVRS